MNDVLLEARNITKVYGKGRTEVLAVNNVSLTITRGKIVLISGPSGSGKTTLLSILGCILTPTSGKLILDNETISKKSNLPKIRKEIIGFVFQSFNLLKSLTVQENVEVALMLQGIKGKKAKEKTKGVLSQVGLNERFHFYPKNLSGGEKQRVSLARAIVNQPKLILADEPTGNLDSKSGRKVVELLTNLVRKNNSSVIIVSHDNRIEPFVDKIYNIEDGMISIKC